jgi:hypothetical protein
MTLRCSRIAIQYIRIVIGAVSTPETFRGCDLLLISFFSQVKTKFQKKKYGIRDNSLLGNLFIANEATTD